MQTIENGQTIDAGELASSVLIALACLSSRDLSAAFDKLWQTELTAEQRAALAESAAKTTTLVFVLGALRERFPVPDVDADAPAQEKQLLAREAAAQRTFLSPHALALYRAAMSQLIEPYTYSALGEKRPKKYAHLQLLRDNNASRDATVTHA